MTDLEDQIIAGITPADARNPSNAQPPADGTRGHSGGEWYPSALCTVEAFDRNPGDSSIATIGNPKERTASEEERATCRLLALAQSAPHDCGNAACVGVVNARKLAQYNQMANALRGMVTQFSEWSNHSQYAAIAFAREALDTSQKLSESAK